MTLSFIAIKLRHAFGLGPAAIGFLLGLGPLMGALAAPFAGSISDRIGRKAVLSLSLISIVLGMVSMRSRVRRRADVLEVNPTVPTDRRSAW